MYVGCAENINTLDTNIQNTETGYVQFVNPLVTGQFCNLYYQSIKFAHSKSVLRALWDYNQMHFSGNLVLFSIYRSERISKILAECEKLCHAVKDNICRDSVKRCQCVKY
jgi:hypothetical protein